MKSFDLAANLLAGLTHTVNQLSPQDKAKVNDDPVEANRLVLKAIAECEEFNSDFMRNTKETADKLQAAFDAHKKILDEKSEGKSPEERARLGAEETQAYRKESEAINAESHAEPDTIVTCTLSDEKVKALQTLIRLTVGQWQDSALFVKTAEALDNALDVKE